ncbi:UNVERIFIED_CONTAM: activating signal cointegrator 1 complex subunit [Gekko kuhli]
MIRILGLSATLPNYLDVATFLHVNPYIGLFYFDGRFRPVPLGQTFIGIKTTSKVQQLNNMDEVCYENVLKQVTAGHQVYWEALGPKPIFLCIEAGLQKLFLLLFSTKKEDDPLE